jgi:hypothetical protein
VTTHHHAETLRAAADLLTEIGTPVSGTRSEHERGLMYGAERLRRMADETTAEQQKDTPAPAGAAFTAERTTLELQALLYEAITRFQTTAMITGLRLPQIRQYLTEHLYIALTGDSAPSLTIYRAEHDTIVAGRYTTQAAARAHCEALISREYPTGVTLLYDWIEDEEDRVAELVVQVNGGTEFPTGYTVTGLDVASSYEEVPE